MTKIVVGGASGDLGQRITALLLEKVPPQSLTLVSRTPEKLAAAAARGARVCKGDHNDPAALEAAYRGADVLMLISGLAVTRRVPEHRNAINAAKKAGIKHIVYTSVAGIHPRNGTLSARDHIRTEADLRESGLGFTVFRDATYAEAFPMMLGPTLRTGKWFMVKGHGRLAPVSKADVARCAAVCLTNPEFHNGAVYEISGPDLLSFREIAALTSKIHGIAIEYVEVTPEERFAQFDAMGIPRDYSEDMKAHPDAHLWASNEMVSAEIAFQQGFHGILTDHVEFITGQRPIALAQVLEAAKAGR